MAQRKITDWLPTSKKETEARGWKELDVILFSGDAYVDHPSFGAAVIGRILEAEGLRMAIVPQPNWRDDLRDFRKLGVPRLFFAVSAGSMDSMVNHYTAHKRLRSNDAYTAGNVAGFRPDYAVTVYTQILKKLFPDVPVVIGGIEASLRRLTHYDYWQDRLQPSILVDSRADLLVYGMGEHAIRSVAHHLQTGKRMEELTELPQTAYLSKNLPATNHHDILLHPFEDCVANKRKFAENFRKTETESNKRCAARLIEPVAGKYVVVNPPEYPQDEKQVDAAFDLPYTRLPHPRYQDKHIVAFEMIKYSVNIHRGCFGGCSFCTISAHQGKFIACRSEKSIIREVEQVIRMPGFKGYLSDLGGPSANMFGMKGKDPALCERCSRYSCIYPRICRQLDAGHGRLLSLYRKIRNMDGIRKVFIGSGIRYDLLLDANGFISKEHAEYFRELLQHHVSGRLKVAPEHTSPKVLKAMRKPSFDLFMKLNDEFHKIDRAGNLRQQLIPYFISSHPACEEADMKELSVTIRNMRMHCPEQVQDFTPTPMTLSSVMFYCGFDPYSGEKIHVTRKKEDKQKQKQYFFRGKPEGTAKK
ncbi:MAG: YgiQ family radical SAM protein [Bacteroidales bacterium]|nr:YgiQ family radical SAM protein [Bacteroidales bacterium]